MLNVAIVVGSTRPGRKAEDVARWVFNIAAGRFSLNIESKVAQGVAIRR